MEELISQTWRENLNSSMCSSKILCKIDASHWKKLSSHK